MLKKLLYSFLNRLWVLSCRGEYKRFEKTLERDIKQVQKDVLLSLVEKNKDTEYGKKYGFSNIKNIKHFQEYVPLSHIEDYTEYIGRIAKGQANVLTSDKVLLFELSSGSTSSSKLIPYTKGLKTDFHKGLFAWLYDIYYNRPELLNGRAYWSLSPLVNEHQYTEAGIKIGFEKDSEYFGFFGRFLFDMLLAVPSELRFIKDIELFRHITLLFLLKEKSLSFISIWNPTFLELLLNFLMDNWDRLISDLRKGTITTNIEISPKLKTRLERKLGKNKKRASELESIYKEYKNNTHHNSLYECIWENVSLISCWTDSHSALFQKQVKKYFPNVEIQGKGLLSTEGIISFPLTGLEAPIIAIRSHFFEFKSIETNEIKLLSELELGKEYSVVITTNGGFYRYQLADVVSVKGFHKGCPLIRFMGKEQKISDYFGEKLNEYHISKVLKQAFHNYNLKPEFYMIAPEKDKEGYYFYVLYIELDETEFSKDKLSELCIEVEKELEKNFHYEYCIRLKQLQSLRAFIISEKGNETYITRCKQLGQKVGDIKPSILHTKTGWAECFKGDYLA